MAEAISDLCFLVRDLDRAIEFYRDRVGFKLRRLAPGFADFFTGGVTLALWQVDHMQSHLGLPPGIASRGGGRTMAAVQVESSDRVRAMHEELSRIDPLAASRIASSDAQRIQRALEVYRRFPLLQRFRCRSRA